MDCRFNWENSGLVYCDTVADCGKFLFADALDVHNLFNGFKAAVSSAVFHDSLRNYLAYAVKTGKLCGSGSVDIDEPGVCVGNFGGNCRRGRRADDFEGSLCAAVGTDSERKG